MTAEPGPFSALTYISMTSTLTGMGWSAWMKSENNPRANDLLFFLGSSGLLAALVGFGFIVALLLLLRQFRERCNESRRRRMDVADLHPIRREHSARAVAIVVGYEDRTATRRYHGDDCLAVLRRRKCSEEPAAILLLNHQREWNAGESRFTRLGIRMMGSSAKDDRMTVALPSPALSGIWVSAAAGAQSTTGAAASAEYSRRMTEMQPHTTRPKSKPLHK